MKKLHFLLIAIIFATCAFAQEDNDFISNFVTVKHTRFIDNKGRTLILSGVNYVNKNGILSENDKVVFKDFKKYGYNIIRFGIIWDRLEHKPGVMDESYLEDIDKRVEWARENGIYLMLDFHQDLYSSKWSDGAPLWATIDDNLPHALGEIWSDSYFLSPALNRAFDNFWNNHPAEDGMGIQDHYLNMLKVVAQRYAKSPSVIGIDIFNEPYGGTSSTDIPTLLLKSVTRFLPDSIKNDDLDLNSLKDKKYMTMLLKLLENKSTYKAVLSSCADKVNQFERNQLSTFYQKVRDAMRGVGFHKIIFLEHNYFSNLGIRSDFVLPKDEKGRTDLLSN
jgi:endoglycosylceramidase